MIYTFLASFWSFLLSAPGGKEVRKRPNTKNAITFFGVQILYSDLVERVADDVYERMCTSGVARGTSGEN